MTPTQSTQVDEKTKQDLENQKRIARITTAVSEYKKRYATYKVLTETLQSVFRVMLAPFEKADSGAFVFIEGRTKRLASYAKKMSQKIEDYADPLDEASDFSGIRIIVESHVEVKRVREALEELESAGVLVIDRKNSSDKLSEYQSNVFGYGSVHYVVAFAQDCSEYGGVSIDSKLRERRSPDPKKPDLHPSIYRAEVQVRTLLEHAWANQVHDRIYKSINEQPREVVRAANRIAAQLEAADKAFVALREDLEFFDMDQLSFRPLELLEKEKATAEAIYLQLNSMNEDLGDYEELQKDQCSSALSLARYCAALGEWKRVVEILSPLLRFGENVPVLIHWWLGVAYRRIGEKEKAWTHLTKKLPDGQSSPDVLCELAELSHDSDVEDDYTLPYYDAALQLKSNHPRALRGHLFRRIVDNQNLLLTKAALRTSAQDNANVVKRLLKGGLYLPWAYFDLALYSFFQETTDQQISEALGLCALGVARSYSTEPMRESYRSMDVIGRIIGKARKNWDGSGITQTVAPHQLCLLLALAIASRKDYSILDRWFDSKNPGREALSKTFEDTIAAASKVYTGRRVVIVAGSSLDDETTTLKGKYQEKIINAFDGFEGTVICPGTNQGSGALFSDVKGDELKLVCYLTNVESSNKLAHVEMFKTPGSKNSFEEVMLYWAHLLKCGVQAEDVRVLGIGGGTIAKFEYMLAAALGASVGLIEGSGRAAEELIQDKSWSQDAQLKRRMIPLPDDAESIRAFVQPPDSVPFHIEGLDSTGTLEILAKKIHEAHREELLNQGKRTEPSLKKWEFLREDYKESNFDQARSYAQKLKRVGLEIVPINHHDESTASEIEANLEMLAQMEHGRWNVERLRQGWRRGKRDDANLIHDNIIGWTGLENDIQQYDRDAINKIVNHLNACGLGIGKLKTTHT